MSNFFSLYVNEDTSSVFYYNLTKCFNGSHA